MPARKKARKSQDLKKPRPSQDLAPRAGVIPHIGTAEVPTLEMTKQVLYAVALGLNVEAASAYANLPSAMVRNWIARGRAQEETPFCADLYPDKDVRDTHVKFYKTVTLPCYTFWMLWRKMRAEFIIKCVSKIRMSKDWKAQAWLMERIDGAYAPPGKGITLKRDLLPIEKEVEATVVDPDPDPDKEKDVIQFFLPENKR